MKLSDARDRYKRTPEPPRASPPRFASQRLMILTPLGKVRPIMDGHGCGEVTLEVKADEYTCTIGIGQTFQVKDLGFIGVWRVVATSHTFTNEGSTIQVTGRLLTEDL